MISWLKSIFLCLIIPSLKVFKRWGGGVISLLETTGSDSSAFSFISHVDPSLDEGIWEIAGVDEHGKSSVKVISEPHMEMRRPSEKQSV